MPSHNLYLCNPCIHYDPSVVYVVNEFSVLSYSSADNYSPVIHKSLSPFPDRAELPSVRSSDALLFTPLWDPLLEPVSCSWAGSRFYGFWA